MPSAEFLTELGIALRTQHQILQQAGTTLSEIEVQFVDSTQQSQQIQELEHLMTELEAYADLLEVEDVDAFDPSKITDLYEHHRSAISQNLVQIGFKDWSTFVRQCQVNAVIEGADPFASYESFLTAADLKRLDEFSQSYSKQFEWDKWDYIFVGASGVLAALTDLLLVGIPQDMSKNSVYAGQKASRLTEWLKQYNITQSEDWFAQWAQHLSDVCKTPYDNQELIQGMYPKSHRFQSLGHDPVLGFVFGVLDIMRGTISGFSYSKDTKKHVWACEFVGGQDTDISLVEATLRQIGHLISDVATPMGLPAPFMTLIQGINAGNFGEEKRTVGQIARWMYLNGYDFRHFLVSGITPATIEIILRAYIMLRHYAEHGEAKFDLASHPKYRTMLLAAHGIASLANAGKIAFMQGNPLALNYAEWMALVRYLIPSIKYWVFDQHQLRLEHMQQINDAEWNKLLQNGDKLLGMIASTSSSVITLGGNVSAV